MHQSFPAGEEGSGRDRLFLEHHRQVRRWLRRVAAENWAVWYLLVWTETVIHLRPAEKGAALPQVTGVSLLSACDSMSS